MKKYKVWGTVDSHSFNMIIEADCFEWTRAGAYCFQNTETGKMWCFPINRTLVETIVE